MVLHGASGATPSSVGTEMVVGGGDSDQRCLDYLLGYGVAPCITGRFVVTAQEVKAIAWISLQLTLYTRKPAVTDAWVI